MKNLKKSFKRVIAVTLALALVLTAIPGVFNNLTTAKALDGDKTWNFRSGSDLMGSTNGKLIQSATGEVDGLLVDATTGKFDSKRGDWAQFNTGAKVMIPVNGNCKITVVMYSENKATLDGVAITGTSIEYDYVGNKGYVNLVASQDTYIGSITVAHTGEIGIAANATWNFRSTELGAYDGSYERNSGEFNGLVIDATNGKCVARSAEKKDTQVNKGTIFTVPVPAESDWTISIMTTNTSCTFKVDGTDVTTYTDTNGSKPYTYTAQGTTDDSKTSVDVEVVAGTGSNTYFLELKLESTPVEVPVQLGNGKMDVVDFGCAMFDEDKYNNLLTVEKAVAFPNNVTVAGDKTTYNVKSFTVNDADGNPFLTFNDGGKTNHRYRTSNENITTRYDGKSLTSADGTLSCTGYIYSNASNSADVNMVINLSANDVVKVYAGSNGKDCTYSFKSPSGVIQEFDFTGSDKLSEMVFYADEDGEYTLWVSTVEKLVVGRVIREHKAPVQISGTATYHDPDSLGSDAPSGYKVSFTNDMTGSVTAASVKADGSYKAYLYEGYTYSVALIDANGYVVDSANTVAITADDIAGGKTFDISVKPVAVTEIRGTITNLSAEALALLTLDFVSDKVYVPEITINRITGEFVLYVEAGVEYSVIASNVNDYTIDNQTYSADSEKTDEVISFTKKPVYSVTVNYEGLSDAEKASAKLCFTNIEDTYLNAKGDAVPYSYEFAANDNIELRNGQYQVKVTGLGALALEQAPTADVKINDAVGSTTVKFYDVTDWNFEKYNSGNPGIETVDGKKYYVGLALSDTQVSENKQYLLVKEGGTISIPVKKGDNVKITYCYQAAFTVNGQTITTNTGSTSTFENISVVAPEDGQLVVTGISVPTDDPQISLNQTYFTQIQVTTPVEYKDVVTVGNGKDYTTINDALAAIKLMDRPNNERVTIMVDPGNYEEMLNINVPNVTLKNAAATPSIGLTNKGVDIEAGAVRITSYYGHGYTYYSMGKDCKYDADLLAANKSNGYPSFVNPGSGTTNGSYWNATVVVTADGFRAEDIIFENSFNQYISAKAAEDVIVPQSGAKGEDKGKRSEMAVGSTAVQNKAYVERAAALAIYDNISNTDFIGCKFIGRQDTLYGGRDATVVFDKCSIYGGTDYIFGGMNAVFYKCDLVANTSEDNNDTFYITAAQQKSGRGYLMYNCTVTSTTPGVDTASQYTSKPGYLGRPWEPNTSEVVFYNTIIETTNFYNADETGYKVQDTPSSLIVDEGWNTGLGGKALCYEFGTQEKDGSTPVRADWAPVLSEAKLPDGTEINLASFFKDASWLEAIQKEGRLEESSEIIEPLKNGLDVDKDGVWHMYKNDAIDTTFTGLAQNEHGWWYVAGGDLDFNYNGIVPNENGWWKVTNGKVDFTYTGIAQNEYGWWRIVDGKVDFTCNSVVQNEFGWWKITDGKVDFGFTGVAGNEHGWWYIKDGKVDFTYNGQYTNGNESWFIMNGKVKMKLNQ